jgi:hypothetical protein
MAEVTVRVDERVAKSLLTVKSNELHRAVEQNEWSQIPAMAAEITAFAKALEDATEIEVEPVENAEIDMGAAIDEEIERRKSEGDDTTGVTVLTVRCSGCDAMNPVLTIDGSYTQETVPRQRIQEAEDLLEGEMKCIGCGNELVGEQVLAR